MFPPADWLKQQYEQGRKYSGTDTLNPWKRTTEQFRAWDEGYRGVPFSSDPPAAPPKPARPAAGFLFD